MKLHTKARTVATVLMADAAIHIYWATGAVWPAHSLHSLTQAVLNADIRWNASVLLPIAGILVTGATALLARSHGRGGRLAVLGSFAVAAGLSTRGAAGLVWITGVGSDPKTPFYWLNLLVYAPACVILAPLALSVATGRSAAGIGRLRAPRRVLS